MAPSFAWFLSWARRGHDALLSALDALGASEGDAAAARRILLLRRAVARHPLPGSSDAATLLSVLFEEMAGHDAPWVAGHLSLGEPADDGLAALAQRWEDELEAGPSGAWLRAMRPPAVGLESGPALSTSGAGSPVLAVCVDGTRQAAVTRKDGSVVLLSLQPERVMGSFQAPCEQAAMVFAPGEPGADARVLVTGGNDGSLRVWDASGERRSWKGHRRRVERIACSRSGTLLSLSTVADEAATWAIDGSPLSVMTASDAAFSADGTRIGWSRTLHAWVLSGFDVARAREIWSLPGYGASFPGRVLDGRGERIACCNAEGPRLHHLGSGAAVPFPAGAPAETVQLLDDGHVLLARREEAWICSADGRCLERYPTAGAFEPFATERWLVSTSYVLEDIRVNVWDRRSGERILSAPTRRGFMASRGGLLDQRLLAVAAPAGAVVLHDLVTGEQRSIPSRSLHLYALLFSADGALLLTSGSSESVELWDVASRAAIARHDLEKRRVLDARLDPHPMLLVQHYGEGLEITDPRSGRVSQRLASRDIERASLSPDGARVVAASKTRGLVRVWDRRSGDLLLETMGDAASFDDSGDQVVVLSLETRAGVRDLATGRDLLVVRRASSAVSAGGLSGDGRRLFTLSQDVRHREEVPRSVVAWPPGPSEPDARLARLWDVDSGSVLSAAGVLQGTTRVAGGERPGSFRVDAPWRGGVRLVDTLTGEEQSVSGWAAGEPGAIALRRGDDPALLVYTSSSGAAHRLSHPSRVTGEAASPDGAWVVSGCEDGSVHVWRLSQVTPRVVLDHDRPIQGIAWSRDGGMVATWSGEGCLVWSTETALVVSRLDALSAERVAFSEDGRSLLREDTWESEMRGTNILRDLWGIASKDRERELDPLGPWPEPAASPYDVKTSAGSVDVFQGDRLLARLGKVLSHASCRRTPWGVRLVGAEGTHLAMYALRAC